MLVTWGGPRENGLGLFRLPWFVLIAASSGWTKTTIGTSSHTTLTTSLVLLVGKRAGQGYQEGKEEGKTTWLEEGNEEGGQEIQRKLVEIGEIKELLPEEGAGRRGVRRGGWEGTKLGEWAEKQIVNGKI